MIIWVLTVLLPLAAAYPRPDARAQVILVEAEVGSNYTFHQFRTITWFRNIYAPGRPSQFQFTRFCEKGENEYEHCEHFTDYDLYVPSPGRIQLTEDGLLTIINVTQDDIGEYFPAIWEKLPSQRMVTVRLQVKVPVPDGKKTVKKRSITVTKFAQMLQTKFPLILHGIPAQLKPTPSRRLH